jgi:hypothetical protein
MGTRLEALVCYLGERVPLCGVQLGHVVGMGGRVTVSSK